MINLLIRWGWLPKPMPTIHRCGWEMIARHIVEASKPGRLS